MEVTLVSESLLPSATLLHRVDLVADPLNGHLLLLEQEVVHLADHLAIALLADMDAAALADPADGGSLVDHGADDGELWLRVTDDPAHHVATVDADLDAHVKLKKQEHQ